jgi:DDE_Tnp_1-associated
LFKTINHFFPDLLEHLRRIEDCRSQPDYALTEILMAAIAMFIFQQGSRNAFNNLRQEAKFAKHYWRLFKLRLPHLDTVHRVLCQLADDALEHLKQQLVKTLLEKKALHKYRLFGRYFVVAIDATGMDGAAAV